ncbi:MAG: methylase [Actinomycetia bacterium]|nr:methylase [Actinomycetes bacterium]
MPPNKKTTGPTAVDAILHSDKRVNVPTAEAAAEYGSPESDSQFTFSYPRPLYEPQLVWRGKEELDLAEHLEGNAPPIYIQEKLDPRVLVENLRRTTAAKEDEPELTLFDTFDGLPELDLVDFYRHEANWSNRMILGDSLNVMASLAERELLRGKVQTIYLDPPYGIKFGSNWQVSARKRDVKDGKLEDATREVEQIKAFRDTWEYGISSYLTYLRDRLTVARELLTESGSIFVQIGDENVHLVRALLDEVFGAENFVSQITCAKTSTSTGTNLSGTTDYIVWYSRQFEFLKYRPLLAAKTVGGQGSSLYTQVEEADGNVRPLSKAERADPSEIPRGARAFGLDNMTSQSQGRAKGEGAASWFEIEVGGRKFTPGPQARWKTNAAGMHRLVIADRVRGAGRNLGYVRYIDDFPAFPLTNLWTDTLGQNQFGGDKVYVVQTALKIVERCMLMTTDPGDLVLDPTCGSGTTAYVAEQWGRRWITVDTSRVALALARQRVMGAKFPWYLLADTDEGRAKESALLATPLPPAETTGDIRHGFVYERVQHVTLKSIANNPDIVEGMGRDDIDAAIRRHAESELLYDKPYEDKKKVRVAGPFTVESLSPHRSLAFAGSAIDSPPAHALSADGASAETFEHTILANLRTAGIQNGKRQERLTFDMVEPFAANHIQAIGVREEAAEGTPSRVGISIGPQYGTVGPSFIKDAAREANKAGELDLLCVLAFAFDPAVLGTSDDYVTSDEGFANVAAERRLGRVPVLLVRMNADLVMGEELKKTGAGNLFTVFGEPDIDVVDTGDGEVRVVLNGVDVYDPNTGQIRSADTSQIALWMIDTAYNEESFFVRHCYFTGGQDPFARLKRALKADIDEESWASLYRTESRPFAKPESGKIAVKVINDYGDEVMKVFTV